MLLPVCLLLAKPAFSYTQVPSSAPFSEDFEWRSQRSSVDTIEDPGWWFHGGGDDFLNITGTSPQDGEVWGWWYVDWDDPGPSIGRRFKCESYSVVTITVNFFFCMDYSNNPKTYWYYTRTGGFNGDTTLERRITISANDWRQNNNALFSGTYGNYGHSDYQTRGSSPSGTNCDGNVWRTTMIDTFHSDKAPFDLIEIGMSKEMESVNTGYNNRMHAWNAFEMSCSQDPTPAPTHSPTVATGTPTKAPAVVPTKDPTDAPTRSPITTPTKSPETVSPTRSPVTVNPTQSPSQYPTVSPSKMPTTRPSKAPTPRPTEKPTSKPTDEATEQRSFGRALSDATGMTTNETCDVDEKGWMACNMTVVIVLIVLVLLFCCYWVIGVVWYRKRQANRPLPEHLVNHDGNAEQALQLTAQPHATAGKWMSSWEKEQMASTGDTEIR